MDKKKTSKQNILCIYLNEHVNSVSPAFCCVAVLSFCNESVMHKSVLTLLFW